MSRRRAATRRRRAARPSAAGTRSTAWPAAATAARRCRRGRWRGRPGAACAPRHPPRRAQPRTAPAASPCGRRPTRTPRAARWSRPPRRRLNKHRVRRRKKIKNVSTVSVQNGAAVLPRTRHAVANQRREGGAVARGDARPQQRRPFFSAHVQPAARRVYGGSRARVAAP